MRIFNTFPEAFDELKRELKEMGITVMTQTVQDKETTADTATVELMNYIYTVTKPDIFSVPIPNAAWAKQEWWDRCEGILGRPLNPGNAWKERPEIWRELLEAADNPVRVGEDPVASAIATDETLKFSYAYPERFAANHQVMRVIRRLRQDNYSRQLYIAMWDPHLDASRLGQRRVPCSLGWQLLYRGGLLHITYLMRSCELGTHFYNDIWLTLQLQQYIAHAVNLPVGHFTHFMGSFHCYAKNVAEAF